MMLKTWIAATARRLASKARAAIIHRSIEAVYRKQQRMAAIHQQELAALQKQQQDEMQQMAGLVSRREGMKHQLNGSLFIGELDR